VFKETEAIKKHLFSLLHQQQKQLVLGHIFLITDDSHHTS
jgi:hypothetical protein